MKNGGSEVRIAEMRVTRAPGMLVAYGLGSCVGIVLYDRETRVGGMAHVMLPESRLHADSLSPGKFVDTAVDHLLREMEALGAGRERLEARLVGGATMFRSVSNNSAFTIGLRNVIAARQKLAAQGIPVVGEEVGGRKGRTVVFDLEDGRVQIRAFQQPVKWI